MGRGDGQGAAAAVAGRAGRACRDAGQHRPTPLLLRYGPGDFNRLHQDRYGAVAFPLQVAIGLTPPDAYEGGEFLLVEQWPRMQSRGIALRLGLGEGVVFPNATRPDALATARSA